MKYKVIAEILDGTVCATKGTITCFISNTLSDKEDNRIDPQMGEVLPTYITDKAEFYWSYSRKEWENMNKKFNERKTIRKATRR